tara:strand:- start:501 stop:635 length:135 start_codon:yes stop_codon:yes gene_type:complete
VKNTQTKSKCKAIIGRKSATPSRIKHVLEHETNMAGKTQISEND